MKKISLKNAKTMIKGASILSCGGGLPYIEQNTYLDSLNFKKNVKILNPDELSGMESNTVFVTASEIGPADDPPIDKTKVPEMIQLFIKKTGKQVGGIMPVEIGQESIVFDTALKSNLPIINSDLAGLRAVPKASMNALKMQNVPFTRSPLVVLTNAGKILFIDKNNSLEEDEKQLRQIARDTHGVIFAIGGFITAPIIQKYLNHASQKTIYDIGICIEKHTDFVKKVPLPLVYSAQGIIQKITNINTSGFSEKEACILVDQPHNNTFTVSIKNEYMKLTNGNHTFQFPQLITLFSKNLGRGLSSSELTAGMAVQIYVFNPLPCWNNFSSN